MFHIQQPTEQWIDEVVNVINENPAHQRPALPKEILTAWPSDIPMESKLE